MTFDPNKVVSGTHGEAWLDSERYAETYGLQAKIDLLKEKVPTCGSRNGEGEKYMGWEGKGTIRFNKINSRLLKKQVTMLKNGKMEPMTIISKLADPASAGHERIALYGVLFDDITLADWEAKKLIQEEKPFTFNDFELLDEIQ